MQNLPWADNLLMAIQTGNQIGSNKSSSLFFNLTESQMLTIYFFLVEALLFINGNCYEITT